MQALQDKEGGIRIDAAEGLGHIAEKTPTLTKELLPALLQAMQDKEEGVRSTAAQALGRIAEKAPILMEGVLPALLQALQDKAGYVRAAAVWALGRIAEKAPILMEGVLPALLQTLQDKEGRVRKAAAKALGRIAEKAPTTQGLVSGLLQALRTQNQDVQEKVLSVFTDFEADQLLLLYLDTAHQATLAQRPIDPAWLRILVHYVKERFPGIVFQENSLQVITDTPSDTLSVADAKALSSLSAALQKQCKQDGSPLPPTWDECCGKTPRYSTVKKPPFKPSIAPTIVTAPHTIEEKPIRLWGLTTAHDKSNRSLRLRDKFPALTSSPTDTEGLLLLQPTPP